MRHDLRKLLGSWSSTKGHIYMKASDVEQIFQNKTEENMEALETALKDMTADVSKHLDDIWAKYYKVPKMK